jgi:Ca2+-binding RTX toxin-like protein
MNGTERAAWTLKQGGFMSATLEVDAAPNRDGVGGKLVVGQIHGQHDELVRLYWENGTVYFVNDQAGSNNSETKFTLKDDSGATPNVSLNEKFSYTIKAKGSALDVDIYADGKAYHSHTIINSVWQSDTLYFKAGAYLGANETNGSGYGQTSFYALSFNHDGTTTTPSTPTPTSDQDSSDSSLPVTTNTVSGSDSNNYVIGVSSNDLLKGNLGRDVLWGEGGSDVLYGGTDHDADAFVFDAEIGKDVDWIMDFNPDDDMIRLDNSIFTKLTETGTLSSSFFTVGKKALDANDHIIYNKETGVLSYDADGSGSGAAVQFGVIDNKATLTASHFTVF